MIKLGVKNFIPLCNCKSVQICCQFSGVVKHVLEKEIKAAIKEQRYSDSSGSLIPKLAAPNK